jgi:hypothetical protein
MLDMFNFTRLNVSTYNVDQLFQHVPVSLTRSIQIFPYEISQQAFSQNVNLSSGGSRGQISQKRPRLQKGSSNNRNRMVRIRSGSLASNTTQRRLR